jgi:ElaB/YqjD/DUF883 family membrane-anchored ribosome-binding protein
MAEQTEVATTRRAKSPRTRAVKKNGHARRTTRRRPPTQVSELERIIANLEAQIAHLTSGNGIRSTIHGATNHVGRALAQASNHVGDVVADKLTGVAGQVRNGANSVTGVARVGTSAARRIGVEVERHPFMTVAIALGLGFMAGMAGRQE